MSTIWNVSIFVDCQAIVNDPNISPDKVIKLYADPTIVIGNSQGNYELSIKVNSGDIIRWFAAPLIVYPVGSDQPYSVLITADKIWNNATLLQNWTAYQGYSKIWTYQNDDTPLTSGTPIPVQSFGDYQPYVQAQAVYPGRDPGSQQEAYSFYVNIYQGESSTPIVTGYTWDPYVTVYQP